MTQTINETNDCVERIFESNWIRIEIWIQWNEEECVQSDYGWSAESTPDSHLQVSKEPLMRADTMLLTFIALKTLFETMNWKVP